MQVTYMPYLSMKSVDQVDLSQYGLTIWNYGLMADRYIRDRDVRGILDRVMATNVRGNRAISDMGILSIGEHDWREFNEDERVLGRELRAWLFLATLAETNVSPRDANVGLYMSTSENFTLVEQSFQVDSEFLAVRSGYVLDMTVGGFAIDSTRFSMPTYVPRPIRFALDSTFFQGMARLKTRSHSDHLRLVRATDQLLQAYSNDPKLESAGRILLMASAFEILFELPESQPRRHLRDAIEKAFALRGDPLKTFETHRVKTVPVSTTASIKSFWADTFYRLRNAIIHGDDIPRSAYLFQGVQRHFDIAVLFFILRSKRLLEDWGCIEPTMDRIKWGIHRTASLVHGGDVEYEGFQYEKGTFRRASIEILRRMSLANNNDADCVRADSQVLRPEPEA